MGYRVAWVRPSVVLALASVILIAGCTRPEGLRVREGANPEHRDEDVAFRTTYFFRTFDYCAYARDVAMQEPILPLNDALYRFEMTGKASTLLSSIKFESGVLKSWEIDPFGAKISFDPETGEPAFQSREDTESRARAAGAYQQYRELDALYQSKVKAAETNAAAFPAWEKAQLEKLMQQRLEAFAGQSLAEPAKAAAPVGLSAKPQAVDDGGTKVEVTVQSSAPSINGTLTFKFDDEGDFTGVDSTNSEIFAHNVRFSNKDSNGVRIGTMSVVVFDPGKKVIETPARLTVNSKTGKTSAFSRGSIMRFEQGASPAIAVAGGGRSSAGDYGRLDGGEISCPEGATYRRGYQILGPQGMSTYNQDDRLIMAMSSSARPLISVMEELSGRVLNAKSGAADRRLIVVEESARVTRAQLALTAAGDAPADLCAAVVGALTADTTGAASAEELKKSCGGEK